MLNYNTLIHIHKNTIYYNFLFIFIVNSLFCYTGYRYNYFNKRAKKHEKLSSHFYIKFNNITIKNKTLFVFQLFCYFNAKHTRIIILFYFLINSIVEIIYFLDCFVFYRRF